MPSEVETMFTARKPAWHGLGVMTPDALTSRDAIVKAGLDWTVSTRPLFTGKLNTDGVTDLIDVNDHYATVRDSDDSVLGVVGSRYLPIQNLECFDFLDTVVDDSDAKYETAGSLYNGRVIWLLLNLNKSVQVDEDITHNYLLLTNSHDGTSSLKGLTTPIRVVCANTLRLAIGGKTNGFSFKHTSNLQGKVAQARATLTRAYDYVDTFQLEMERLLDTEVTNEKFDEIMTEVMPLPVPTSDNISVITRINNNRSTIENLFNKPEFDTHRNTGWAFINATSNFEQWVSAIRGKASRDTRLAQKTLQGTQSPITDKVYSLI
jgi:phage/plasmid-like protein (TIGR03299 family)